MSSKAAAAGAADMPGPAEGSAETGGSTDPSSRYATAPTASSAAAAADDSVPASDAAGDAAWLTTQSDHLANVHTFAGGIGVSLHPPPPHPPDNKQPRQLQNSPLSFLPLPVSSTAFGEVDNHGYSKVSTAPHAAHTPFPTPLATHLPNPSPKPPPPNCQQPCFASCWSAISGMAGRALCVR